MRRLFSEYGTTILELICSLLFFAIFISLIQNQSVKEVVSYDNYEIGIKSSDVVVDMNEEDFVVSNASIAYGSEFNYLDYVEAHNTKGEDVKSFVSVLNNLDTTNVGENIVKYVLRYNGQNIYKTGYYYVLESEDNV